MSRWPVLLIAALMLVGLLGLSGQYGFHGDEMLRPRRQVDDLELAGTRVLIRAMTVAR